MARRRSESLSLVLISACSALTSLPRNIAPFERGRSSRADIAGQIRSRAEAAVDLRALDTTPWKKFDAATFGAAGEPKCAFLGRRAGLVQCRYAFGFWVVWIETTSAMRTHEADFAARLASTALVQGAGNRSIA